MWVRRGLTSSGGVGAILEVERAVGACIETKVGGAFEAASKAEEAFECFGSRRAASYGEDH